MRILSGKWDPELHQQNSAVADAIGIAIRRIRLERMLSQTALAEKAGVATDLVVKVEGGDRWPSVSSLVAVTSALDISMEELVKLASRIAAATLTSDQHKKRKKT
jgi:transcriptional regulator with XRE-family HTH domain